MQLKIYSDIQTKSPGTKMADDFRRNIRDHLCGNKRPMYDEFNYTGTSCDNVGNKRTKIHDIYSPLEITQSDSDGSIDKNDLTNEGPNQEINNGSIPFAASNWWKKGNDHLRELMTTSIPPMGYIATNRNNTCDNSCSSINSDNDSRDRVSAQTGTFLSPKQPSMPSPIPVSRTPPRGQEGPSWLQLLGELAASGSSTRGVMELQQQKQQSHHHIIHNQMSGMGMSSNQNNILNNNKLRGFDCSRSNSYQSVFNKPQIGRTSSHLTLPSATALDPSIFSMESAPFQQMYSFHSPSHPSKPIYSSLNFHYRQRQTPRQTVSPPGGHSGKSAIIKVQSSRVVEEGSASTEVERDLGECYQEVKGFGDRGTRNGPEENQSTAKKDSIAVTDTDDLMFSDISPIMPSGANATLKVDGFDCEPVDVAVTVDTIGTGDSSSDGAQSTKLEGWKQSAGSSKSSVPMKEVKFRAYQAENWTEKFEELLQFRAENGHCLVPNCHPENPALAQWTKRQRYQYKLKQDGKRSTITDERVQALEEAGFVWDSHKAVWAERLEELKSFKKEFKHCNVPSRYQRNHQLAIWVKRQRRQWKNKKDGLPHCMTDERQRALEAIGFVWDMKKQKKQFGKPSKNPLVEA